jgi:hypothetical protein
MKLQYRIPDMSKLWRSVFPKTPGEPCFCFEAGFIFPLEELKAARRVRGVSSQNQLLDDDCCDRV